MNEALQAIVVLSLRELCCCLVEIASVDCVCKRRVVTNVAFCYVSMKPNSQKNDVRCEYTRGAPEPSLLQIPIDMYANEL